MVLDYSRVSIPLSTGPRNDITQKAGFISFLHTSKSTRCAFMKRRFLVFSDHSDYYTPLYVS